MTDVATTTDEWCGLLLDVASAGTSALERVTAAQLPVGNDGVVDISRLLVAADYLIGAAVDRAAAAEGITREAVLFDLRGS